MNKAKIGFWLSIIIMAIGIFIFTITIIKLYMDGLL